MAAKKAFLLIFLLVLTLSINSVLGHGTSPTDEMKGAAEGVKESASNAMNDMRASASAWGDWFKNKVEYVNFPFSHYFSLLNYKENCFQVLKVRVTYLVNYWVWNLE